VRAVVLDDNQHLAACLDPRDDPGSWTRSSSTTSSVVSFWRPGSPAPASWWPCRNGRGSTQACPRPQDPPLRSTTRTVLTPHLGFVPEEPHRLFFGEAVEDMRAWADGGPVRVLEP